jgi:hypothetical protein
LTPVGIFSFKQVEISIVYMDISGETPKKSVIARRMIQEINEAKLSMSPAVIAASFPEYQKEFPTLFSIINNPNPELYPPDVLEMMLKKLEAIEAGQTSRHDASVAVGTVLVNQFVKPNLKPR